MIDQLSRRDRLALLLGGIVVLATLAYIGIVEPYIDGLAALDAKIESKQRQLSSIRDLRREYLALRQQLGKAESRLTGAGEFSLFSFIEALTAEIAGKENLVYMRPQPPAIHEELREESVEVKLEKVTLQQIVRLLYEIETAEAFLPVKNLRLRTRFDDRSRFDAVMTISAFGKTP